MREAGSKCAELSKAALDQVKCQQIRRFVAVEYVVAQQCVADPDCRCPIPVSYFSRSPKHHSVGDRAAADHGFQIYPCERYVERLSGRLRFLGGRAIWTGRPVCVVECAYSSLELYGRLYPVGRPHGAVSFQVFLVVRRYDFFNNPYCVDPTAAPALVRRWAYVNPYLPLRCRCSAGHFEHRALYHLFPVFRLREFLILLVLRHQYEWGCSARRH